jgi:hypothetical protein
LFEKKNATGRPLNGLGHTLRGTTGRSAKQKVDALRREDAQNGIDDGSFANAGTTLDISTSRIAATCRSIVCRMRVQTFAISLCSSRHDPQHHAH